MVLRNVTFHFCEGNMKEDITFPGELRQALNILVFMVKYRLIIPVLLSICLGFQSCAHDRSTGNGTGTVREEPATVPKGNLRIEAPESQQVIVPGKEFKVRLNLTGTSKQPDSVQIFLGAEQVAVLKQELNTTIHTGHINPSNSFVRARAFFAGGGTLTASVPIKIVSDIEPAKYTYRVIREFPHDVKAYTQGLEFIDGYLYEGTGNYGESSLRKEDLETGEILKFRNLPSDVFGEGITYIHNKIYQITYKAQAGFIYNANNFELLQKIYYQNKEGWGLCNNGNEILMSDGTNIIYFMDTTYFSQIRKIQVFDNTGEVDLLNELELIGGKLYANRYTTNEIVIIDPSSGRVEGKIDMSGILKPSDRRPGTDYFNGIAYDKKNNRIFVTGKYWPKLYEVEFIKVR